MKVKKTEYRGFEIEHGRLFKIILTEDGPIACRSMKEAKEKIDQILGGGFGKLK